MTKNIDKILGSEIVKETKKMDLEKTLIVSLKSARATHDKSKMTLPEEIALSYDMTYNNLVKYIDNSKNEELKKEWLLYKEALKIKFMLIDKDTMKEGQANYNLGMDSKSLPDIGFYFGHDERMVKALEAIIVQTNLQREKNLKEAQAMGIEVMSNEEKRELETMLSVLGDD